MRCHVCCVARHFCCVVTKENLFFSWLLKSILSIKKIWSFLQRGPNMALTLSCSFTLAKIFTYMVIKWHSLVLSVLSSRFIVVDMGPFWSLRKGLPREDGVLCGPQAGGSSPEQHGTQHLQANWDDSSSKPGRCAGSNEGGGGWSRSIRWEGRGWKVRPPD